MSLFKPESFKHYFVVILCIGLAVMLSAHFITDGSDVIVMKDIITSLFFLLVYGIASVLAMTVKWHYAKSLFRRNYKFGGCIVGLAAFCAILNVVMFLVLVGKAIVA